MRMIVNYYDPDDGELVDAAELFLDNDKFDTVVGDKFIADFDRCEHGRHHLESCVGCPDQLSRGNPGNYNEIWYDAQGSRIYAFTVRGAGGWIVADEVLGISLDLP